MRLGRRHDLDSRKIDSGVKQGSAFVLLTGHNQSCRFARCPKVDLLPTRSARPVAGKWRRSTVKAHFGRDRNLRRPRKARSSNLPMAAGSVLPNARHSRSPLEARVAGSSRWSQNRHPPTALFVRDCCSWETVLTRQIRYKKRESDGSVEGACLQSWPRAVG
jgi:hypothetical protein